MSSKFNNQIKLVIEFDEGNIVLFNPCKKIVHQHLELAYAPQLLETMFVRDVKGFHMK